ERQPYRESGGIALGDVVAHRGGRRGIDNSKSRNVERPGSAWRSDSNSGQPKSECGGAGFGDRAGRSNPIPVFHNHYIGGGDSNRSFNYSHVQRRDEER